ncbi:MAG: hypothetical protein CMJ20_08830 [Phycisphaeraceae bacterium]|nr:hypothetical protein [Phycisphaeraceae bacterium]|tara:strand:- start:261 stop:1100 length:840 start_codon:yes stop_codon:yes gene_type:complete
MPELIIDERDWSALTIGEQIKQIEVEGYLVLPNLLDTEYIEQLKEQLSGFEYKAVDYSIYQKGVKRLEFRGGSITELIGYPPTIAFLKELFGDEVIMMSYTTSRSEPGHPGISLHADGQPYGSEIFGYQGSCPFLVRVLYYLDDLTKEISPFRVVPRSHLCLHEQANPYGRYQSHPEEVMVPVKAGSAVLINHRVFHGNYPNVGDKPRSMLAIAYRPGWAGPVQEVEPWETEKLAALPDHVKPLLADPNTRHWDFGGSNKPKGMISEAPGMNPSRWDRV